MAELTEKLTQDVKKFLEVYKVLLPEGKALFESKILETNKKADEKTKKLYQILIDSARHSLSVEQTIEKMQQA